MICPVCGNEIPNGTTICASCGTSVEQNANIQNGDNGFQYNGTQTPPHVQNAEEIPPQQNFNNPYMQCGPQNNNFQQGFNQNYQYDTVQQAPQGDKGKNKVLIVVGIVALVLFLCCCCPFLSIFLLGLSG